MQQQQHRLLRRQQPQRRHRPQQQEDHIVKHYSGRYYRVLSEHAQHSVTGQQLVVYQALYKAKRHPVGQLWVHDRQEFKLVMQMNGAFVERFTPVKHVPRRIRRLLRRLDGKSE